MPKVGATTSISVDRNTTTMIDAHVFDAADEAKTSNSIDVSDYKSLIVLIDLAVVLAPTDIVIDIEFSDDDSTFYKLMEGPFGDLRYEDSAGALKEALQSECYGKHVRVVATSSGCDGSNTFTLTVKITTIN